MNIPKSIKEITISNFQYGGPLPPLGFVNIEEGGDGAGNNYGLYWEIGKEDKPPIICWFDHDEGVLEPSFPTLSSFLRWHKLEDKADFSFKEGEDLFFPYFNQAKLLNKKQKHEEAIQYLEHSVQLFGEHAGSWYLLNLQYLKTNDLKKLKKYFPEILKANWACGAPSNKQIKFMNEVIPLLGDSDDPILKLYNKLNLENGWKDGLRLNYNVLKEIIAKYHAQGDYISALKLKQNHAYSLFYRGSEILMEHNFNFENWQTEYDAYSKKYLVDRKYCV
jgi:hypothetical protein